MSITEIMQWQNAKSRQQQLSIMLAMHSAPLLCKSKISNIVTIPKRDFAVLKEMLRDSGISYRLLRLGGENTQFGGRQGGRGRLILFLYRRKELHDYLDREDVRTFLRECGYDISREGASLLTQLAKRIGTYRGNKIAYPHEIGIFLGYPIEDVRGFVEHHGEGCAYSGYWKVYSDVERAKRLFARYEENRDTVVRAIMAGKTIREIAV